jgi:hypothetical protein
MMPGTQAHIVMAGLVPAIHVLDTVTRTWMPGTSRGVTVSVKQVVICAHIGHM